MEQFSTECRQTKLIIVANKKDIDKTVNQSKLKVTTSMDVRSPAKKIVRKRLRIGLHLVGFLLIG